MFVLGMWFCSPSQLIIHGVSQGSILGPVLFTFINPFAPEPPVTAHAGQRASNACDIISFTGHGQLVTANLCRVKRSFKPYQNEHNLVKDTGEKGKKPCNIDLKISMKIFVPLPTYLSFHLIPRS